MKTFIIFKTQPGRIAVGREVPINPPMPGFVAVRVSSTKLLLVQVKQIKAIIKGSN